MTVEVCEQEPTLALVLSGDDLEDLLTITGDCDGPGMWFNALTLPDTAYRLTTAPPSAWQEGDVLLAAVRGSGAVAARIAVRGSDAADLAARKATLASYLARWSYLVLVTTTVDEVETVVGSWVGMPTAPVWGDLTPQLASLHTAVATVSIPVNPGV